MASSNPHRPDRKHVQGRLVPDDGGVLQPLDQVPPDLETGGRHQGQPQARQVGRQDRDRDQPAPQSFLPGVLPDHAAVGGDIRAADLEDTALARRQILRRQQIGQHVVHGDGLGRRRQPAGAEHHRQTVGQRLDQIEGQAARPDHQGGPELDGFYARVSKNLADLVATSQVRGEFRVGIVAQATQVDDAPHPGIFCRLRRSASPPGGPPSRSPSTRTSGGRGSRPSGPLAAPRSREAGSST